MGRIKTLLIKRVTQRLMGLHGSEFTEDFNKNKELVSRLISTSSKKLRNVIAGYVTRLVRQSKEPKQAHIKSEEDLARFYR